MTLRRLGSLVVPDAYTEDDDGWHSAGHGAPCPVSREAGKIELYHTGYGHVCYPKGDIDVTKLSDLTGVPKSQITNYSYVQNHTSIGMAQFATNGFTQLSGDKKFYSQQLVRPSYPFGSYASQDVRDPYVIPEAGGGITRDKTMYNLGDFYTEIAYDMGFWIWVIINGGAKKGDVIAQKGNSWKLYFSDDSGYRISFTYTTHTGTKITLGQLSLIATKRGDFVTEMPGEGQYFESLENLGRPVLIACGARWLAVSTHEDTVPNVTTAPYRQHNFIFQSTRSAIHRMLCLPGEPLTLGNDWTGKDDHRFRSGGIISARISYEEDPLNDNIREPVGDHARRGLSLMQSTIMHGGVMDKTTQTTWLINAESYNGRNALLDTASATFVANLEPYNVELCGGARLTDLIVDDAENPKNYELHDVPGINAYGIPYVDVRVCAGQDAAFWKAHLGDQTLHGVITADAEDQTGTDATVTMVLSTRDRLTSEIVSVIAWEDMGLPSNRTLYSYTFTVHRLYLADSPGETYPCSGAGFESLNSASYMYEFTNSNRRHYKMLVIDYDPVEAASNLNYYTYGYTLIPDATHQGIMLYVGYDGTYYSLIWNPMDWSGNSLGNQRKRPIYRATRIDAPILYRYADDLYIVFTDDVGVQVLYKRFLDPEWELLSVPILTPSHLTGQWDAEAVQSGGIQNNAKTHQIHLTYMGYDGTDWRIGMSTINNLIAPILDNRREEDPVSETITPSPTHMKGVGQLLRIGSKDYLAYTVADPVTGVESIDIAEYTYEASEVIPGEEFQEYDEFLTTEDTINRVKALHRYYKRNGKKLTLVVVGRNIYRAVESLDDQNRLVMSLAGVGRQTDVDAAYLSGDDLIFTETFNDWVVIAQRGEPLTRWAGGLVKLCGVQPPTIQSVTSLRPGGALPDGTYTYRYTYYTALSESNPTGTSNPTITLSPNSTVRVTLAVPTAPDVVGVKIYRREDAGDEYVHVMTIPNTTTTYWDDTGAAEDTATGMAVPSDHDTPPNLNGITTFNSIVIGWINNTVRWSKQGNPDYWPESNILYPDTGGEDITVVSVIGHQLAAWTATKVFVLGAEGTSNDGLNNLILDSRQTRALMGTVSPRSVTRARLGELNGSLYLGTDRNIWLFSGEDSIRVNEKISKTTQRISKNYMQSAAGAYFNEHYLLCAPFKSNVNNSILDLDLTRGAWSYHTNQHIGIFTTLSSQRDGYVLIGGDSRRGTIYQVWDPTAVSDDGEPIFCLMKTKTFDLGMPETEKRIRKLYYDFAGSSGTLNVTVRVEDDTVMNSQDVAIPGYTVVRKFDPSHNTVSLASVLSPTFSVLPNIYIFGSSSSAPKGMDMDCRKTITDGYQGRVTLNIQELQIDADKYIVFPAEIRGKNFSIEISSADPASDFQFDSLSLMVRPERAR